MILPATVASGGCLLAFNPLFLLLVASFVGRTSAGEDTNVTAPQTLLVLWVLFAGVATLFVPWPYTPLALAALLAPLGVPLIEKQLRRLGWVRAAYYFNRLTAVRFGGDVSAGSLLCATLASRVKKREQDRVFLRRLTNRLPAPVTAQSAMSWALLDPDRPPSTRPRLEMLRSHFRVSLLFPLSGTAEQTRVLALEWLLVEALERRDLLQARRWARAKRSSFFAGKQRTVFFKKLELSDLLEAPSREPWDSIPKVQDQRLGQSSLLRFARNALEPHQRHFSLLPRSAPEPIQRAIADLTAPLDNDVGPEIGAPAHDDWYHGLTASVAQQSAGPRGAMPREAMPREAMPREAMSPEAMLKADQLLREWAEVARASTSDLDDCEARLHELGNLEWEHGEHHLGDDPKDDVAAARCVERLTFVAAEMADPAWLSVALPLDIYRRFLEVDRLFGEICQDFPDHRVEVWSELYNAAVDCAALLWNELGQKPLAAAIFSWVAMESFSARDARTLEHAMSNLDASTS